MTPSFEIKALAAAVADRSGGALAAQVIGNPSQRVTGVAALESAGPDHLAFLANPRYRQQAQSTQAGSLVLAGDAYHSLFPAGRDPHRATIVCDEPYAWFAFAAQLLEPSRACAPGVSPQAAIDPQAQVHPSAYVAPLAVVGAGAVVADGAWIGPGCVIEPGASVGANTRLHGHVFVAAQCRIGQRCIVHAGAVIGADGFGFAPFKGRWVKIPQSGIVEIGDDVEIGANTTIDRGSAGNTIIGQGVKIDNQVQIAHNCRIGDHTVIAGCVGIAGSAIIGKHCQLGGASMIHGHLSIADYTVVGAATLVSRSLTTPDFYTGAFPIMKNRDWEKNAALVRHLVELKDRVRALEKALPVSSAREES
jgi:UDP-3-O-[3-hydroxymyristoyl] glucosamine N-acyltransferase